MLKYSHCGAILSTADQFGINPTSKNPMIKSEGKKFEKSTLEGLEDFWAIVKFSFYNLQDINLFKLIINGSFKFISSIYHFSNKYNYIKKILCEV